jgi:single-strand DNA-binding protein
MNETYVTIRGRLTADPSARTTRTGAPMTKFRLATSARRPVPGQPGQWEDGETSYYDVLSYRSLAANIAVSLRRGQPVTVHGKQRIVSWQREDGTTWYGVEVEADAVGHDLTYGTTAFARVGMGRPAEPHRPSGDGLPGDGPSSDGLPGDPERDPYVVEPGPGRGLGEVGLAPDAATNDGQGPAGDAVPDELVGDSGPLVRPEKEAAA